jgi:hypothetical protein
VDLVLGKFIITVSITVIEDVFSGWTLISLFLLICSGGHDLFKLGFIQMIVSVGVSISPLFLDFSLEFFSFFLWNFFIDAGHGLIHGKKSISILVASTHDLGSGWFFLSQYWNFCHDLSKGFWSFISRILHVVEFSSGDSILFWVNMIPVLINLGVKSISLICWCIFVDAGMDFVFGQDAVFVGIAHIPYLIWGWSFLFFLLKTRHLAEGNGLDGNESE